MNIVKFKKDSDLVNDTLKTIFNSSASCKLGEF